MELVKRKVGKLGNQGNNCLPFGEYRSDRAGCASSLFVESECALKEDDDLNGSRVRMLKQWQLVLYVVTAMLVVATVNQALAEESSDGWRPKSRSKLKKCFQIRMKRCFSFSGEISQAAADDGTQEEPFDWMDDYYGPSDAAARQFQHCGCQ